MEPNNKSNGALVGSIIIILILIIGGLYLYTTKVAKSSETPPVENTDVESSAIESDLNGLETEMNAGANSGSADFTVDSNI